MLKFSLSYLAGALTVGVAVYLSAGNGTLIAFGLGVLTVTASGVAALSSVERIKRAARFLSAFAAGLEQRGGKLTEMPAPASQLETDVVSALVQLGTRRKAAEAAAKSAVAQLGTSADFETTFKTALASAKTKAA
jgi:Holliday junction resolvasome RuvABC DNA-binding subunit